MSNLQLIEALCQLVELQSKAISMLAMELEQMRNLTDAEAEIIERAKADYSAILGSEEMI